MLKVSEQKRLSTEAMNQREAFAATYGEWLKVRGESEACDDMSDEDIRARMEREAQLTQKLWAMPAEAGFQVLHKIAALEAYHNRSDWTDQRDLRLLASIKADLQVLLI